MLKNLSLGLAVMIACLLVQSLLAVAAIRFYRRNYSQTGSPSFWASGIVIAGVMLLLILGNVGQVALWALVFVLLGEFELFREAFYHSSVNFATLGYGDFVMSDENKLLGPLEAINGALMIGVSTATLISAFQDAMQKSQASAKRA